MMTRSSQERAEAGQRERNKPTQQIVVETTEDTAGGGTVTLEVGGIRQVTGLTPTNTSTATSTTVGTSTSSTKDSGDGNNPIGVERASGAATGSGGRQAAGRGNPGAPGGDSNTGIPISSRNGNEGASGAAITSEPSSGAAGNPPPAEGLTRGTERSNESAGRQIIVREKARALKLTTFKGLDDTMPITMWLKTVRAEVRRQAVTMGVVWTDAQLYHEVASHLDGEARRWFATVMESVAPEEESINTLSGMLRAKYMTQRTGPEVVGLLNARRQMRAERLMEYAQALREIGERGDVGEVWLVNAFLKGMSSSIGATHVRGHRPRTLDEAVNLAVHHVGEYGEGYGIGLEAAIANWDEREAAHGRGPLAAAAAAQSNDQEQSGLGGISNSIVTGYGPAWGAPQKKPRYDTEGKPLAAEGASSAEWWKAIPPGYKLVQASTVASSKFQLSGSEQNIARGKRQTGIDHGKRPAKTFKVEGRYGPNAHVARNTTNPAYSTRESRLQNLQRYQTQRAQPVRTPFVPRPGTECFYCGGEGHFARDCGVKQADLAASGTGPSHATNAGPGQDAGNDSRT